VIPGSPIMMDENARLVNKLMELTLERQRVIANNIANANTPGYIRRDLRFTKAIARAIESSGADKELAAVRGVLVQDRSAAARIDGNNVGLPNEMNEMMQNGIFYRLLAKSFNIKMNIMRNALK